MKKFLAVLFLVLIAALMVATCPDKEAHRKLIKERFNEAVNLEMDKKLGKTIGSITSVVTKPIVKSAVNEMLIVDNYGVISVGKLKMKEGNRVISVGLLNHVFTASGERLQLELEKSMQKKGKKTDEEENV